MQIIKEEVLPLLTKPYDPRKAEVGKLYELRFVPRQLGEESIEFFVFDSRQRVTNKTWTPDPTNYCMVLEQCENHTIVLIGEDIVHIHGDEEFWDTQLIPLKE